MSASSNLDQGNKKMAATLKPSPTASPNNPKSPPIVISLSIDRGGTFSDCLVRKLNPATLTPIDETVIKVLSENPSAYSDAPTECVRLGLEWALNVSIPRSQKLPTKYIHEVRIGTTVATNALLERKGQRFALVTTKGFKDLLFIGDQSRPDIFDLQVRVPGQLYEQVVEVDERIHIISQSSSSSSSSCFSSTSPLSRIKTTSGTLIRIDKPLPSKTQLSQIFNQLIQQNITHLAVNFLHAAIYPEHEIAFRQAAVASGFLFHDITLSHETTRMVRAVPRGRTTCANAYLTPKIHEFVGNFLSNFDDEKQAANCILFMRSDGGLESATTFSGHRAVLSGPAGGVVGVARTAFDGKSPVIGFDMGGTSTDICRFAGAFELVFESTTAGVTVQAPQLDVNTVAAGGGSRLKFRNGLFEVGPEQAGARPGPVCYKRPNGILAVTDANVVLKRIVPDHFPRVFGESESESLDFKASSTAFENLIQNNVKELGHLSVEEVALGFVRVANEAMCRPIREMTLMRGFDVEDSVLCSFGGAGGQHACQVARILGIRRIKIHRYAGILSAVGLALSEIVQEVQEPSFERIRENAWPLIVEALQRSEKGARLQLTLKGARAESQVEVERFLHVRFDKTDSFVAVTIPNDWAQANNAKQAVEGVLRDFFQAHQREYGFTLEGRDVVVDDVRVRARAVSGYHLDQGSVVEDEMKVITDSPPPKSRVDRGHRAYFDGVGCVDTPIYEIGHGSFSSGFRVTGPAILLQRGSTVVVEPGCNAYVSRLGDVEIHVEEVGIPFQQQIKVKQVIPTAPDPVQLSLYSHRFMSVAEQMGRVLRRTAVSVNIKERLDFSCAVFTPEGGLVAHAPYIPVHLGAMSAAVRYQIEHWGSNMKPGDVFVSNHPQLAGGSHLPDITVVSPAFHNGLIVFYVASRGHHADIGGIAPGSMPPNSTSLSQEGAAIIAFKLVEGGVFQEEGITRLLITPTSLDSVGTRNLRDNISDLKAQVAANKRGVSLIEEMVHEKSLEIVHLYMKWIQENCSQAVRRLLQRFGTRIVEAEDFLDDGSPIKLMIKVDGRKGTAVFDFTGTGPQVLGNLNAPKAVTLSAIVYSLRCMVGEPIPLNEGCLEPVKVVIPKGSLLDPDVEAAVVGGNVLTSQRVVDVVLKAFGACAASYGCMNNLTFGREASKAGGGGGGEAFGFYETICGGSGAGPSWHGRSTTQAHMTNTRISDPEILETRYPVILCEFSVRSGSGGRGRFHGGDGAIREFQFTSDLTVSILSERRSRNPFGMEGGGDGATGKNLWIRQGRIVSLGGKASFQAKVGDVLRIETPGGGGWGAVPQQGGEHDEHSRMLAKL